MLKIAIVPTHDRHEDLLACAASLTGQADHLLVIDNASTPAVDPRLVQVALEGLSVACISDSEQPPNLSRLWNVGLEYAEKIAAGDEFFVAVLNDDAVVPPGWFDHVVGAMQATGAAAGCTSEHADVMRLHTGELRSVFARITGWAFVLRGSAGIRADERLRWWYGDTAIDVEARRRGGLVISPGFIVKNRYPNASTTGVLAEQAGRDRATFIELYGPVPW